MTPIIQLCCIKKIGYCIYLSSVVKFFTLKIKIKLLERFCKAGKNSRMLLNFVKVLFGVEDSDVLIRYNIKKIPFGILDKLEYNNHYL